MVMGKLDRGELISEGGGCTWIIVFIGRCTFYSIYLTSTHLLLQFILLALDRLAGNLFSFKIYYFHNITF